MLVKEEQIIHRLKNGDRIVFEGLFNVHYKNLVLYAKKFVVETEIARDIVQDVFFYIWEKRAKLTINRSIASYLFRAVHNSCINYLKRESTKDDYIKKFLLSINNCGYCTDASQDAHEIILHKDLSERIELIIAGLPEQCRNIFRMSRFKGLKNKEIAEIYSISPRTVETQIYRALKVLKNHLSPYMSITTILFLIIFSRIFML